MASEENIAAGVFELRAEAGQFSAVISNQIEVAKRFERVVLESFNRAGAAASSTEKLESSSKRYVSAIEREALAIERKTASLVLSATEQRKAEAQGRGEAESAKASLARLEAAEKGYKSLSGALQQVSDINAFGELLAKSQSLGQVEKNIDALTASLNRLQGEARDTGAVRLSVARGDESRGREVAETAIFDTRAADAAKLNRASEYVQFWTRALDEADAKEKELADFRAFDVRLAEAAKLNRASEYVQFWNTALEQMEAQEREAKEFQAFEQRRLESAKLRQSAEYVQFWNNALDQMDAKEKQLAANNSFIAGLKGRSDAIGKTQADLLELQAAERGLSVQAAPYIANLRAQEKALGIYTGGARDARVSTNQLRVAMQQLPAQFTDVFTSLAGGQNPLLVLIQQGGQIKDSFGGVGNAFRALGSLLTPLRLAFAGVAATLGVLGLAYKQGSSRADEFRRAIVFSGNAAGTTVGQLAVSVQTVSAAVGSQGKAVEVLAQLAASGKVAASEFDKLAEAAIRVEREGGPAVAKTIEAFTSLREAPTKGALKLNETTNFLTVGVYKQIKALEEQGRVSEAAAVAQNAYADASIQRSKTLEASLGSVERAWRSSKEAAIGAWSAFAGFIGGIGRPETAIERLASAANALAAANPERAKRRGTLDRSGLASQGDLNQGFQAANAAAGYEAMNAYYEALRAKNVKATAEFDDLSKSVQTPGKALELQLNKLNQLRTEGTIGAKDFEDTQRRIIASSAAAAIGFAASQARLGAEGQLADDRLTALQKQLQYEVEIRKVQASANPLARLNDELTGIKALSAAQLSASRAEEARLARLAQLARTRLDDPGGVIAADAAVAAQKRKTAQIIVDASREAELATHQQAAAVRDLMRALRDEGEAAIDAQAQQDSNATAAIQMSVADYAQSIRDSAEAMRLEQSLSGESQRTRQVAIEQFNIELELRRKIAEINATQFAGDREQATRLRDQAIADAQAAAAIAKASAASKATFDPPQLDAASAAVKDYLDEIGRAGKATQEATRQTMSLLEDDIVQSLATGRFDVKKTIDYMIAEFLRLQIVRPMLKDLFGDGQGGFGSLLQFFKFGSTATNGAAFVDASNSLPQALGGAFSSSGPIPLANGDVFGSPTQFSSGNRRYVMAEAGPEAVMPLKRGSDGKLGVAASGSAPTIVNNMTVNGDVSPQTVALMNSTLAKNNAALIRGLKTGTIGVN
jgi:phage-related minor tail protein